MKIVFVGYFNSPQFDEPEKWLRRIEAYTGVLECLSTTHNIISIEKINYEGEFFQNGVQYYFLNYKRKYFQWRIHRFVKKLQPDIVLVHGFLFPVEIFLLKLHLKTQTKIVLQNHAEKPFTGLKKYLQKLADKCIRAYFFTSVEMGEEWVKHGIIADKQKICGVMEASSIFKPIDKFLAKEKTGVKGMPVFLWAGRLDENKDPLTVVKAFLQFAENHPQARLYMIYHTTELLNKIQEILDKANDGNSVILIGKVSHKEMLYWYNSADFIVSGSHYEGSGVAVCEAMSCGCIPIVTYITAFMKLTANGLCGMLYEPGNVAALLSAMMKTQCLNVEEERKKVLEQFNRELSFNAIAEQVNKRINSL